MKNIQHITPIVLQNYLINKGWEKNYTLKNGLGEQYISPDSEMSVIIPTKMDIVDYKISVLNVINDLSSYYNCLDYIIFIDLISPFIGSHNVQEKTQLPILHADSNILINTFDNLYFSNRSRNILKHIKSDQHHIDSNYIEILRIFQKEYLCTRELLNSLRTMQQQVARHILLDFAYSDLDVDNDDTNNQNYSRFINAINRVFKVKKTEKKQTIKKNLKY